MLVVVSVLIWALGKGTETFESGVIQKGGTSISLANYAELFRKMTDESLEIIARRTAYDLGKIGGIEGPDIIIWNTLYPELNDLEEALEYKIKKNLPNEKIKNEKEITWKDSNISVLDYDIGSCGPLDNSKCFVVDGYKNFSIYDKSIDSEIKVNYQIDRTINSSYFKLLYVGRQIFEYPDYLLNLGDPATLQTILINDFPDLDFTLVSLPDGLLGILIEDKSCLVIDESYCIAPLKPGETGITHPKTGKQIPYDYLKLNLIGTPCKDYPYFDVELVLDISGSMIMPLGTGTRASVLKQAAEGFVDWIPFSWNWQVGVIEFETDIHETVPLTLVNTNADKNIVKAGITGRTIGATNIGGGIYNATDRLKNSVRFGSAGPYIILISDGAPNIPSGKGIEYAIDAANDAKSQGINIISAGIDLSATTATLMQSLASNPDTFINAGSADELIQFFKELGMEICLGTGSGTICGDGVREGTEACDGSDFGGNDCTDFGFDDGTLDCTGICTIDTNGCYNYVCGNGVIEGTEVCDDPAGNTDTPCIPSYGETCTYCNTSCHLNSVQGAYCGDGTLDAGYEACDDGDTVDCDPYPGCAPDCSRQQNCGDGIKECSEECDGVDLGGQNCIDFTFIGGTLSCTGSCTFNTSECIPPDTQPPTYSFDSDNGVSCGPSGQQTVTYCDLHSTSAECWNDTCCYWSGSNCLNRNCNQVDVDSCEGCGCGLDNSVIEGTIVYVSTLWNDDKDLDFANFWHNESSSWEVSSYFFSSNPGWFNYTIDTTGHSGKTTCWYETAVDSSGNLNDSMSLHCFDVQPISNCNDGIDNDGDGFCDYPTWSTTMPIVLLTTCTDGSTPIDPDCSSLSDEEYGGCGNNRIELTEECDGSDLNGKDCTDFGSFAGGTLSCINAAQPNECRFNTSECRLACDWTAIDCSIRFCMSGGIQYHFQVCGPTSCIGTCTDMYGGSHNEGYDKYCPPLASNACTVCGCSGWINGDCYKEAVPLCPVGQRRQTRACDPAGCDIQSQCIPSSMCCGSDGEVCTGLATCININGGFAVNKDGCLSTEVCCHPGECNHNIECCAHSGGPCNNWGLCSAHECICSGINPGGYANCFIL